MENGSPISSNVSYPIYTYIIVPIVTAYVGIFVTISNHYVLKPKIESFLARVSLSSELVRELIIDLLSNMSFITYAFSSFLLTSPTDNSIRLLFFHNTLWVTLCLGVVMTFRVSPEFPPSNIILMKNTVILSLCCIDVLYHYFSGTSMISLPLIMTGLYIVNLLINSNEEKFISFTLEVLGLKKDSEYNFVIIYVIQFPKCNSNLPSVSYLAKKYPVSAK